MKTRYTELTAAQKLGLTPEALLVTVKLEAIARGIELPTELGEQLLRTEAKGFNLPPDAVRFFELCAKTANYGAASPTGIAFRTEAEALRALEGAVSILSEGYDQNKRTLLGDPAELKIQTVWVTNRPLQSYWTALKTFEEDTTKFDELCEECRKDLAAVRQAEYDTRISQQQRKQYLELADGNAEIAAAFWRKTKGTDFPAAIDETA